jgi:enoyl-CoA hydratase
VAEYKFVTYEELEGGKVVRITLNRPEARNAQNRGMLVDLDNAFRAAEKDDAVRVVILRGAGPMFSSGHDMGSKQAMLEMRPGPEQHETAKIDGGTREGAEWMFLQEWHYFFQNTLRWRNLRKITIAEVHGKVYSAGLMLMWACDLIVAAEGTEFADVVATRLGMCGMEYFAHPFEFGPRKAKELMLTSDSMSAEDAARIGMVTKIFKADKLSDKTVKFANRIAKVPTMTALMIKESVNQAVDNTGFYNALNATFTIHQLNHSHWAGVNEDKMPGAKPEHGVPPWNEAPPIQPANLYEP